MTDSIHTMVERHKRFNAWFARTYQDADGKFSHLPSWLKADLRNAWDAADSEAATLISELQAELEQKNTPLAKQELPGADASVVSDPVSEIATALTNRIRRAFERLTYEEIGDLHGIIQEGLLPYESGLTTDTSSLQNPSLRVEPSAEQISRIQSETIEAAYATCRMFVEEECYLDQQPVGMTRRAMHRVGLAIRDRINCAIRSLDRAGSNKTAQSNHSPSTLNTRTE